MTAEQFPLMYSNNIIVDWLKGYPDNAERLDGKTLPLDGYTSATFHDLDQNGRANDLDNDDATSDDETVYKETWTVKGQEKKLMEIAKYNNSTIHYKDGRSVIIDATVLLFTDGTYAVTSKFDNVEQNNHVNWVYPGKIDYSRGVTLGSQDSEEIKSISEFRRYREFFCFTEGTLIETLNGNTPVEDLKVGDAVRTMDNGYQAIRWIGTKEFTGAALSRRRELIPVRIKAGVLGNGLPRRDLIVSRQHRVLVRSDIAQRMYGATEVLIPAIKLVTHEGIEFAEDIESVSYWHILFDNHEIIYSEGAPTESFLTGPMALKNMSTEFKHEIMAIFPEIMEPDFIPQPARHVAENGAAIRQLVTRHMKNGKPLFC